MFGESRRGAGVSVGHDPIRNVNMGRVTVEEMGFNSCPETHVPVSRESGGVGSATSNIERERSFETGAALSVLMRYQNLRVL